jgi:hypothetical protein
LRDRAQRVGNEIYEAEIMGRLRMRAPALVLSLALGVPACMGYQKADAPPPNWIAVPPGVAEPIS